MNERDKLDIYKRNGYKNRSNYLQMLAEDYDVPLDVVEELADLLGPSEDFDGLIAEMEDLPMRL